MELKTVRDQLKARAEEARGKGDHFVSEQFHLAISTIAMLEARVARLQTAISAAKDDIESNDVDGAFSILKHAI